MSAVTKQTPEGIIKTSSEIEAKGAEARVPDQIKFGGEAVSFFKQPSPEVPINDNKNIEKNIAKAKSSERSNVIESEPKMQEKLKGNLKQATQEIGQDKKGIQNNSPDEPNRIR